MRKILLSLSAAAALTFAASAGQAMPLSADVNGIASPHVTLVAGGCASSPHVTLVYGGCGPYGHRGPWGGCRRGGQWGGGYWRGGYWGGAYYPAGACPFGYHLGPQGRLCWPN
jgi:hypothetical protein